MQESDETNFAVNARVLVVDDNPMNRKLARFALERAGYRVESAVDATEVLERVADDPPELILMDIQLPDLDGLALTEKLLAQRETEHVIVIAVTAYSQAADRRRALAAGCVEYMTKPVDTELLVQHVRRYLGDPLKA